MVVAEVAEVAAYRWKESTGRKTLGEGPLGSWQRAVAGGQSYTPMVNRSCSLGPLRSITGSDTSTSRAASGARTRSSCAMSGVSSSLPGGRPPPPHVEALEPPCASRLTSFDSPPQPLGRGRVGTVEPCREELPLAPGAVRQMPFTNDVRCAVRRPGRRRRPGRPGCAAAPARRTFRRRFAASLADHGSRCAESGEDARRTQKGASDSDAGLHRDAASKAHADFVER
jgi:hypothetical protein